MSILPVSLLDKIAKKYKVPREYVESAYRAYWVAVNQIMRENLDRLEFGKPTEKIHVPFIGTFYIKPKTEEYILKQHDKYRQRERNSASLQSDSDDGE